MKNKGNLHHKLKSFFIPHIGNNHHPISIRPKTLTIYLVFILVFNILAGLVFPNFGTVAASDISPTGLVTLANQERTALGLSTLNIDQRLVTAAYNKGQDMLAKDYWAHFGPNGETPWQFIIAAGYSYEYAGENLAKDFTTTDAVHQAWMNSPTHKANIIKSEYRDIGISVVEGELDGEQTVIVVQMFGKQIGASDSSPAPEPAEPPVVEDNSSKPEPTPTSAITRPTKPVIEKPKNGDLLNQSKITIEGKADDKTTVDVYDGEDKLGSLLSEGGIFTYKASEDFDEGDHILSAFSKNNEGVSSYKSDEVKITIDTIKPQLQKDGILLVNHEENEAFGLFTIEVKTEDNPESVTLVLSDGTKVELEKIENNVFSSEIKIFKSEVLGVTDKMYLKLVDKAGNITRQDFDTSIFTEKFDSLESKSKTEKANSIVELINGLSFSNITMSTKQKVNLGFVLFLLLIFGIDLYYISKDENTRDLWSTRHIPLMVFIIFLSLVNASGTIT